jgi:hypothetical protein
MRSRRINTQQNGSSPDEDVTSATQGCRLRYATTNTYLREWQAKPATVCSKSSYESDSYYPNHADVREAPTNYRRNPWEQVKAYYYSDEYYSTTSTLETPTLTTCTSLIQTAVMSTTLTTSTLETPTLTMPTLRAISLAPVLIRFRRIPP